MAIAHYALRSAAPTTPRRDGRPADASGPQLALDLLAPGIDVQGRRALPKEQTVAGLIEIPAEMLDGGRLHIGKPGQETEQILIMAPCGPAAELIGGQQPRLKSRPGRLIRSSSSSWPSAAS